MVNGRHFKNRFLAITQHSIVWFRWNVVQGSRI